MVHNNFSVFCKFVGKTTYSV